MPTTDPEFFHFYTFHFDVRYTTPDGNAAQRYHSVIMPRHKATLPMVSIKEATEGAVGQLAQMGLARESLRLVSHISTTYHGIMTEKEFLEGIAQEEVEALEGKEEVSPTTVPSKSTPYDA